jgi:hypothetical protein
MAGGKHIREIFNQYLQRPRVSDFHTRVKNKADCPDCAVRNKPEYPFHCFVANRPGSNFHVRRSCLPKQIKKQVVLSKPAERPKVDFLVRHQISYVFAQYVLRSAYAAVHQSSPPVHGCSFRSFWWLNIRKVE